MKNPVRLAWRLTGLVGVAVVTVVAGAVPADASSTTGWRIVSTTGSASSKVAEGNLVVTGADDAWTTWTCGPCPSGSESSQNLMLHWNGQHWSSVDLPTALRSPTMIEGMQASSSRNLWVFDNNGRAEVFNGSGWASKDLPKWVERPIEGNVADIASAVFSASDVWAFSIDAASDPTLAGHYQDGHWRKVSLPVIPSLAIGLAPDDIWVYGFAKGNGPRTLAHWDGTSWKTVAFPHAAAGATLIPSGLVALSAKSVWSLGEVFGPKAGKVSFELLHWDGRWATTPIPASVGDPDQFASDGAGGFWLITTRTGADDTESSVFAHFTGGHWRYSAIPTKGDLESEPGVLAQVPGTKSMLSIGFLVSGSTPEYGEILRYDP